MNFRWISLKPNRVDVPQNYKNTYFRLILKFVFRVTRHISILKQARDVIAKYEQYLQVENMAKVDSAYGFLELVEALRDTSQTEMKSLIRNYNNTDIM